VKTILALDLGTHCGWAYRSHAGKVTAGTWTLAKPPDITKAGKTRADRKLDPRIPSLYRKMREVWLGNPLTTELGNPIDFIVFEDLLFSGYTKQTQLWSSLRAAVWLFCYLHGIPTDCCPASALKKYATGSGAADKEFMVEKAKEFFPGVDFGESDDAADALHLLRWGSELIRR
jgi:Holliday junction resolvasome RuvABC endonuclease subunit